MNGSAYLHEVLKSLMQSVPDLARAEPGRQHGETLKALPAGWRQLITQEECGK